MPVCSDASRLAASSTYLGNAEAVDDDDREARGAIVEHQAARVQFVVDAGGRERRPPADDRAAERRRDVARRGAGLQPWRLDVSPRLRHDRLRRHGPVVPTRPPLWTAHRPITRVAFIARSLPPCRSRSRSAWRAEWQAAKDLTGRSLTVGQSPTATFCLRSTATLPTCRRVLLRAFGVLRSYVRRIQIWSVCGSVPSMNTCVPTGTNPCLR